MEDFRMEFETTLSIIHKDDYHTFNKLFDELLAWNWCGCMV